MKKTFAKRLFIFLMSISVIISFVLPIGLKAEDTPTNYFVWHVDESDMSATDKKLLTSYLGFEYKDILDFEECYGRILSLSTKHDLAFRKKSFNNETDARFKTSIGTDFEFIKKYKDSSSCGYIYTEYLNYSAFLEKADLSDFISFYTYLKNNVPLHSDMAKADSLFRTKVVDPVLDEYCFSSSTGTIMTTEGEGREENFELFLSILKANSEKTDIPVSVRGLYKELYDHYKNISEEIYSTDIFKILIYDYYDIKGRTYISEELKKYAEYMQFTEYCERFRYASTVDTMSRLKQSDIMSIISGMSDYTLYYKENIRLKKMYYELLCNDVYYQNKTYREQDFEADVKEFRNTKVNMSAYYGAVYADYNNPIFSYDAIGKDIETYNNKATMLCPKAKKSDLIQYETQVTADGNAYSPIAIKEDKFPVAIVVVIGVLIAMIFAGLILVKVAYYKLKEIPKPRW